MQSYCPNPNSINPLIAASPDMLPGSHPIPRPCTRFWKLAVAVAWSAACISGVGAAAVPAPPWPGSRPAAVLPAGDDILLDQLQRAAFRFFQEQADPRTGLVRDRARSDGSPSAGKASIAASGFALSAWAVATQRGWVERPAALVQVRKALRFLADKAPRKHGFFYHFMEMDTGSARGSASSHPSTPGCSSRGPSWHGNILRTPRSPRW